MNSTMTHRLARQPGEVIDRRRELSFFWNGRRYPAYQGDTIVSALAACGVRVFSRSFKYHRPRGILSGSFFDPNCTVQVGDEPNVRGAHRRVEAGMQVKAQNVWPSLAYDAKSINAILARFLGAGFYYKTFIKPKGWWTLYGRLFQNFIAGGKVESDLVPGYYDKRYAHPDVLVAGGGLAGMAAAVAAARADAQVMLVEEEHDLGGHLRWAGEDELERLRDLRAQVHSYPSIEVLTNSVVTARYDDNWIAIVQRGLPGVVERLIKARARTLVVAAGLIERPYVFEGNDLPGVMLSTAARRLIGLYAVLPGKRAVVFTANGEGDAAAADLQRCGVEVAAIVDARRSGNIVRAKGRGMLQSVVLADGRSIDCDLLVIAAGWTAPTLLLNMAGNRPVYEPRAARFMPGSKLPGNVLVTGGLAGDGTYSQLVEHATSIGAAAASRAGYGSEIPVPVLPIDEHPALFRSSTHGIIDFSEDVTSKDIGAAAREGYDSVELVKRYTTATMGPVQGKLEAVNTIAALSEVNHLDMAAIGTTTWRPPYAPITLGALAGRNFEPILRSPMQSWHESHGAKPLVAGLWLRPAHYRDPQIEVHNTRTRAGIIDVTPLGKFELHGPDCGALLDLLYLERMSTMEVGSVRYGVMCTDEGVVFDDGVVARLEPDRFLITTTSGGASEVGEWIENWLQRGHPEWRVHVTPMTAAFASINVAGPNSRDLLLRFTTGVDLDSAAFPYMRIRIGTIAGVEGCYIMKIGFTGDLSYEIHAPASYGLFLWEKMLEVGNDLGVQPFGVEAQRILRLEKGHPIIGQDTNALTPAITMGTVSRASLRKPDFVGKPEIEWRSKTADYPRLVGLQPADSSIVPPEACQIVDGSRIVGRITSSCMSPTLGRPICLAEVVPNLATPGTTVSIRLINGKLVAATVTAARGQFDPKGTRLHG